MKPLRGHTRSRWRTLQIRFAKLMRWLHIYLSMISLAIVLFFGVTGITLNHPDWFYDAAQGQRASEGDLEVKWLHPDAASVLASANGADGRALSDPAKPAALADSQDRQVAKLEIVEQLRATHMIHGALTEFRVDETECIVSFKGPGYSADAFIERESGHYRLTESYHGLVAVINDLHKGRDTGPVWSVVIDVSAVLMTAVSLTGLVLLFYLKLKRVSGVIVALAAAVIVILLFRYGVP
jgi:uncharacterized protein